MRVFHDDPGLTPPVAATDAAPAREESDGPLMPGVSFDEQCRQSIDSVIDGSLQSMERELRALVATVRQEAVRVQAAAVDLARRAFEDDAERRLAEGIEQARQEWQASHEQALLHAEAEARATVEQARAEADEALRVARLEAEQQLEAVRLDARGEPPEDVLAELHAAQAEAGGLVTTLASVESAARADERGAMLSGLRRLLTATERIDRAASLKETLDTLAESVAAETTRSMVLVSRGAELRGWHAHGFARDTDPAILRFPAAEGGPLGDAATRGCVIHLRADLPASDFHPALQSARLADHDTGIAVPVALGPHTVAVVYADDGGRADTPLTAGWPEKVQILARHASRSLEALTAMRTAGLGAPVSVAGVAQGPMTSGPATTVEHDPAVVSDGTPGDPTLTVLATMPAPPADVAAALSQKLDEEQRVAARRFARLLVAEVLLARNGTFPTQWNGVELPDEVRAVIDHARQRFNEQVPGTCRWRDELFDDEVRRTLDMTTSRTAPRDVAESA